MRPTRRQLFGVLALLAGTVRRGMAAPPEVLDYFRGKDLAPRFSWLDVWGEEHAHAFTVAGVTETKVLAEFRAAIDKAIVEGWGYEKFRAELQGRLSPLGWWGPRRVADPEGRWRTKRVDFSVPRRLQTTFWSNIRAARAAGQWNRIQRTKRALPYLLYLRSVAERKRPEHLRWAGTILPVDHPWWSTHFPPNGWGCRCSVRQISAAERDDYLGRPASDDPRTITYDDTPPDLGTRRYVNARTGEVTEVPVGIDPGWHNNPGLSRARTLVRQLQEQLDAAGPERAARTIAKLWDHGAVWPKAIAKMPERVHLPVAASAQLQTELEAQSATLAVASDVVTRKVAGHAGVAVESFGLIQRILDEGEWLPGDHPTVRRVLAVIDGTHWVLAIRRSSTGYVQVRSLYDSDEKGHRRVRRQAVRAAEALQGSSGDQGGKVTGGS